MAGMPMRADGTLHGLLTWGFSTVVMLLLLTTAIGGAFSGAAKLFGGITQAAQSTGLSQVVGENVAQEIQLGDLQSRVQNAAENVQSALQNPQTQQNLRQGGEQAAEGTATAGYTGFFLLLIAGLAAAFGGRSGVRRALIV